MDSISLEKLKELSIKVEEWANRYDIEKSFYEDLYSEHVKTHKFIETNPTYFQSKKDHTEALCLSGYISLCLLARINEINETEDH